MKIILRAGAICYQLSSLFGLIKRIESLKVQFHDFVDDAIEKRNELRCLLQCTHFETWNYEIFWGTGKPKALPYNEKSIWNSGLFLWRLSLKR